MSREETSPTSENWNIADGYVKLQILLPLVDCNKMIKIAIYGTENIEDSFVLDINTKTLFRIEALKRFADTLRSVIDDTNEICLKNKGQELLKGFDEKLDEVDKYTTGLSSENLDGRNNTRSVEINENHFKTTLNELRKIKREIIKPLKDAGLIFPISEEMDLDKIKNQLIYGG